MQCCTLKVERSTLHLQRWNLERLSCPAPPRIALDESCMRVGTPAKACTTACVRRIVHRTPPLRTHRSILPQVTVSSSQSSVPGSRFPVPGSWFPLLGSRLPVLGSRLPVLNNKVLSLAGIKGALKSTLMDRILKAVVVISIFQIADNAPCNYLSHTRHPGNQQQAAPLLSLSRRPTAFWQFHAPLSVAHHQYTEQRTRRPTSQRDTGWL